MAMLVVGCGSSTSSSGSNSRELALERVQFERVTSELRAVEPAVRREVGASRTVWPSIAAGLPQALPVTLRASVSAASASATALPEPTFLASARTLTGPAAGIGGIYESYNRLAERGWKLTGAAVEAIAGGSPPAVASFERQSSSLYIDAIYDGHFDLSLLGKSLLSGYEQLGGPSAFGAALTQGSVQALAAAYSIPAVRLEPHPAAGAKEG